MRAYLVRFEGSGFELRDMTEPAQVNAPLCGLFSSAMVLGKDQNDAIEKAGAKILNVWRDRGYDDESRGELVLKVVEVIPTSFVRWVFFSRRVKGFTFFPSKNE